MIRAALLLGNFFFSGRSPSEKLPPVLKPSNITNMLGFRPIILVAQTSMYSDCARANAFQVMFRRIARANAFEVTFGRIARANAFEVTFGRIARANAFEATFGRIARSNAFQTTFRG